MPKRACHAQAEGAGMFPRRRFVPTSLRRFIPPGAMGKRSLPVPSTTPTRGSGRRCCARRRQGQWKTACTPIRTSRTWCWHSWVWR